MSSRKAIALAAYESVKLPIYYRPVKVKLKTPPSVEGANGTSLPSEPVFKTYDSFQIAFYEGGRWRTARAPRLTKAKAKGREIARRLAENGAEVADLSHAETGVQRRAAEPQTEARRKWRSQVAVRDERERNAANRPPPGGGFGQISYLRGLPNKASLEFWNAPRVGNRTVNHVFHFY